MVNKYRRQPDLTITFEGGDWIYNPITDMYHSNQVAITQKFIDNYNNGTCSGYKFEPVHEIKVNLKERFYDHPNVRAEVEIEMPKDIEIPISRLQEIIYNALNSQK